MTYMSLDDLSNDLRSQESHDIGDSIGKSHKRTSKVGPNINVIDVDTTELESIDSNGCAN